MLTGFDHIVLVVEDVSRSVAFYSGLLDMEPVEYAPGKWSLHFGKNKISLQQVGNVPPIAAGTVPGSGNFCILSSTPIAELVLRLKAKGIAIVAGPDERIGATGPIQSVYFKDPDGNLVEISNPIA